MAPHLNASSEVKQIIIPGNQKFPNNIDLPVIVYQAILNVPASGESEFIKGIFEQNGWSNSWTDSIYTYHHYHSNTHEVVGVSRGRCMLLLGGDDSILTTLEKGDVVLIPAGVSHKNVGSSDDFECVGAYPKGADYDMMRGEPGERELAEQNIKAVPIPETDPVFGNMGPVLEHWSGQTNKKAIETRPQF
ncbi:hypothetical protein EXU57_21655 [Segetibacter sp. 3557_3]|uniref:cupin domain-containing protein n=1 Tax=Segetibacter sp. 3557_3 TaxID=2547429 RepID=UPI0010584D2B|nr:cupin domain-containing protein [Segetibacter sp. 3557_3]TDH20042.1 hypothetical protein EXU57_21655 [Segetibacter sp. 3557_3]